MRRTRADWTPFILTPDKRGTMLETDPFKWELCLTFRSAGSAQTATLSRSWELLQEGKTAKLLVSETLASGLPVSWASRQTMPGSAPPLAVSSSRLAPTRAEVQPGMT